MSSYRIPHETLEITVGWDNPMQSLFSQVIERFSFDDDLLLWVGSHHDEIATVAELQSRLADYTVIPADIVAKLQADMANAKPRTALQERVLNLFSGVR